MGCVTKVIRCSDYLFICFLKTPILLIGTFFRDNHATFHNLPHNTISELPKSCY
jgi:hypothetical protein